MSAAAPSQLKRGWLGLETAVLIQATVIVIWLCGSGFAFWRNRSLLFAGFDGSYMLDIATRQISWRTPLQSAMIDWYQGLGGLFASFNARLMPGFYPVAYFGGSEFSKVLSYCWFLAELTLAILFLTRALQLGVATGALAAAVTCLLMFPFYDYGLLYWIMAFVPQLSSSMAVALVMVGAIIRFGRRGNSDLLHGGLFLAGVAWFLFASALGVILVVPLLGISSLAAIIASEDRRERLRKLVLLTCCAIIFFTTGPALYLAGLLLNNAANIFPLELQNDRATFLFASILFHWESFGPSGTMLVLTAVVGAVLSAFNRSNRALRILAITLVTYLSTRLIFAVLVIAFDFWRGPSPLYFEFFVIPIYALFAAVLALFCLKRLPLRLPQTGLAAVIFIAAGALAVQLTTLKPPRPAATPFPPRPTEITRLLQETVSQRPGERFRGRVANMIGRTADGGITWPQLHQIDNSIVAALGNDHRLVGLHMSAIPTLFNYNSTISPAFYLVTRTLLARPEDRQMRSVSVLRQVNPTILQLLGVSHLITDSTNDKGRLQASLIVNPGLTLRLYRFDAPNLGDYSPTRLLVASTAAAMLGRMEAPDFDPRRDAIVEPGLDIGPLVPAVHAEVSFQRDTLRVRAVSSGRSLIVLPYEYSRCIRFGQESKAQLLRVNLLHLGLLFEGEVDLRLIHSTGPFVSPGCLLKDRSDMLDLDITNTATTFAASK